MKYYVLTNDSGQYLSEERGLYWLTFDLRRSILTHNVLEIKKLLKQHPTLKIKEISFEISEPKVI